MAEGARYIGYEVSTDHEAVKLVTKKLGPPVHIQNTGEGKAIYYYDNPEYEPEGDAPQGRPESHREIVDNAEIRDLTEALESADAEVEEAEDEQREQEREAVAEAIENAEVDEEEGPSTARAALEKQTKAELMEVAQDMDISGRSSMDKDELIDAILEAK